MWRLSRPILVFWLFLEILVGVMAFLLTSIVLNVGEIFFVLILVLVFSDSSSVDVSGRNILALALLSGSSSIRTTVLFLLGLCRRGLVPT